MDCQQILWNSEVKWPLRDWAQDFWTCGLNPSWPINLFTSSENKTDLTWDFLILSGLNNEWWQSSNTGSASKGGKWDNVYSSVALCFQVRLFKSLGVCSGCKQWWSLLNSITEHSSKGKPVVPPSAKLVDYSHQNYLILIEIIFIQQIYTSCNTYRFFINFLLFLTFTLSFNFTFNFGCSIWPDPICLNTFSPYFK